MICPFGFMDSKSPSGILWYGGINYLGFEKAANGAMWLCCQELGKELMDKMHCGQRTQMVLPDM